MRRNICRIEEVAVSKKIREFGYGAKSVMTVGGPRSVVKRREKEIRHGK